MSAATKQRVEALCRDMGNVPEHLRNDDDWSRRVVECMDAAVAEATAELADALEAYLDRLGGGFLLDAGKPIILARIEELHLAARAALAKAKRQLPQENK